MSEKVPTVPEIDISGAGTEVASLGNTTIIILGVTLVVIILIVVAYYITSKRQS